MSSERVIESRWEPLELFAKRTGLDCGDFMFMGGSLEGLSIFAYKHCDTRRYLHVSASTGEAYSWASFSDSYTQISDAEAVAHVLA
jgi:hypothetical protein